MSFRSISCGFVNEDHIDQEIEVAGWIHRRRDHGGVIFFDLRYYSVLLQVVYNPEDNEAFSIADGCRNGGAGFLHNLCSTTARTIIIVKCAEP